jgi:hypothetical protein
MHLIAANLWTWIRYVLIEESSTIDELRHAKQNLSSIRSHDGKQSMIDEEYRLLSIDDFDGEKACHGATCVLGNFSEFM